MWCRGVVVFTTAQLPLTKPELSFYAGSNQLAACQIFAMERISDSGAYWK